MGAKYVILMIEWDYDMREVHLSMPEYAHKALTLFSTHHQENHSINHNFMFHPKYGQKQQFMEPEDIISILNKKMTKFIQEVTGTCLFYVCTINSTMLMTFSAIASE